MRRLIRIGIGISLCTLFWGNVAPVVNAHPPEGSEPDRHVPKRHAAIVIDDFGNDMQGTKEMLELQIPITVAVMPFLPSTRRDAEWAHANGKEVIVHLPMEPIRGKKSWLGPGAITSRLSDEEVRERVEEAIDQVPYAVGINNHMGSKVTSDLRIMRIVLQVCKERGLFFLDSRTTGKSVIPALSKELGVKSAGNQIFFDEVYTSRHISKQIDRFRKRAVLQENCIAIGHVGPPGKKTAEALKRNMEWLTKEIDLVPLSRLME